MDTRSLIVGAAAGCAVMYWLDPSTGGRRRALVRDKMTLAQRKTRDGLDAAARDLGHRAAGLAAEARGAWSNLAVDDPRLAERVRAKLGRIASHPRAIDVSADDGCITLTGPILAAEADQVVAGVAAVRGVRDVINALDTYETADGIPSLQGDSEVSGPMPDILQKNWSPATRALVAAGLLTTGLGMFAGRRSRWNGANHGQV